MICATMEKILTTAPNAFISKYVIDDFSASTYEKDANTG